MGELSPGLRLVTQLRDVEHFSTEQSSADPRIVTVSSQIGFASRPRDAPRDSQPPLPTIAIMRDHTVKLLATFRISPLALGSVRAGQYQLNTIIKSGAVGVTGSQVLKGESS
jgi:hypothetical protein